MKDATAAPWVCWGAMGLWFTYQHTESIFFEIRCDITTTYSPVQASQPLKTTFKLLHDERAVTIDDVIYFWTIQESL